VPRCGGRAAFRRRSDAIFRRSEDRARDASPHATQLQVCSGPLAHPSPTSPYRVHTKQIFVTEGENLLTGRNGGRKSAVPRNETRKFLRALRAHSQQCCTPGAVRTPLHALGTNKDVCVLRGRQRSVAAKTSKQEIVFLAVAICPGPGRTRACGGISRLIIPLRAPLRTA
jgi:hypothetical protein